MTLDIMDGDLWQWDTGREVEAAGCEQVHFAKSTAGTCYTVAVADSKAKIPDELLQAAGRVYAWAYITDEAYGGRTRIEALWDVKRRAKPAEYVYEPSDQRTIKDAETARDEAKGARATTLAPGTDATAAMEGNVLVVGVPKGDALRYSDLTAEQVAELKKPATDAAAEIGKTNEEYKAMLTEQAEAFGDAQRARAESYTDAERARDKAYTKAETNRNAAYNEAEGKRQAAERVRGEAEEARKSAETGRDTAEKARVEAEAKREQGWTDLKAEAEKSVSDAVERADAANKAATKAIADVKATEAKLYPVAENVLKGTAKGTFVHVDDAFPSSLLGIEIEGATEQGSTTGANLFDVRKFIPNSSAYGLTASVEDGFICIRGTASGIGDIQSPSFSIGQYIDSSLSGKQLNLKIFGAPSYITRVYGLRSVDEPQIAVVASIHDGDKVDCKFLLAVSVDTLAEYEPYTGGKPSPSPDYPQEIKVIENPVVKVTGRNLLDFSFPAYYAAYSSGVAYIKYSYKEATLPFTTNINSANGFGFALKLKPGIYTLRAFNAPAKAAATIAMYAEESKIYSQDDKISYVKESVLTAPISFTAPEGTEYVVICFAAEWGNGKNQITYPADFKATVERSGTTSDYTPYTSQMLTFSLPAEHPYLAKLPDGKADEIVVDKDGNISLIANVGKYIVDTVPYAQDEVNNFGIHLGMHGASDRYLCEYLSDRHSCYGHSVDWLMLYKSDVTFTTVDEVKQFLKGKVFFYQAKEPKTYPLGKITLPALPESVSNVWTDAEVTPKTTIEYTKDVNIVIANIESAIASIS